MAGGLASGFLGSSVYFPISLFDETEHLSNCRSSTNQVAPLRIKYRTSNTNNSTLTSSMEILQHSNSSRGTRPMVDLSNPTDSNSLHRDNMGLHLHKGSTSNKGIMVRARHL